MDKSLTQAQWEKIYPGIEYPGADLAYQINAVNQARVEQDFLARNPAFLNIPIAEQVSKTFKVPENFPYGFITLQVGIAALVLSVLK